MVTDGDIDIAAKASQQTHQSFNGHVAELPIDQPRRVRLTKAHAFGRCNLGQLLPTDDTLNSGRQFSFEQLAFSIGDAEISNGGLCQICAKATIEGL